jgi:Asp-tRNA(Asn)/Glu-tRNA(Gln) amidotransferase A subunit family amidase
MPLILLSNGYDARARIAIAKTDMPAFGAGSRPLPHGLRRDARSRDPTGTCGGLSGGAAFAPACGLAPLGDGSDTGETGRRIAFRIRWPWIIYLY